MCPTAHAGRRRRDVPQGKDCPFCSFLPAQPVVAVVILILCGANTNLVGEVGGLKKMLKSKHVCVFLLLSNEKVTTCQFLGQRKSLHLDDTVFWKLVFVNVLDVLLTFPSEQMFLGLKKMGYNHRQGICFYAGTSQGVQSLMGCDSSFRFSPLLHYYFSGLSGKNRKESWLYKARIEITYPVLTVVYCRGLKFVLQ